MRIMKNTGVTYLLVFLYVIWTHGTHGTQLKGPRPIHKEKGSNETPISEPPSPSLLPRDNEDNKLIEEIVNKTLNPWTDVASRLSKNPDDSDQTISGSSFPHGKTPLAKSDSSTSPEDSGLLFNGLHLNGDDGSSRGPLKDRNGLKIPENKLGLLLDPERGLNQTSLPHQFLITPPNESTSSQDETVTPSSKPKNDTLFDQGTGDPNSFSSRHQPSGSIYVESVHKSVYPEKSLRVGPSTPCPKADFEDKDLHELSHSQFGYPKSIVSKALGESHFTMMLKMLEDQIHLLSYQNENKTNIKDLALSPETKLSTSYTNQGRNNFPVNEGRPSPFSNLFGAPPSNSELKFDTNTNLFNGVDSTPREDEKEALLNPRPAAVDPNANMRFPFNLENGNGNASPHLLEGSAFESQLPLSPLQQSSSDEPTSHRYELFNRDNQSPSQHSIFPAQVDEMQDLHESQPNKHEQHRFSKFLPDVSGGGGPWFTSSIYPRPISSFDEQRTTSHNSGMDRLFPPKSSDNFLDISSSNELGPNNGDSFIKYSPDTSSIVSSPFQLDTKSLFSSLSGVSVADDSSQQSSGKSLSEFQPQTSVFPHAKFTSLQSDSSKKLTEGFQSSRFSFPRRIRRKRQAGKESAPKGQQKIEDACSASHKLLRQYKNYGGSCFVVQPEIQGIHFVTCTNSRCRGCHEDGGESRCQASHVPMWVWSYCEEGPNAGKVMADRVAVSVACTCKVSICTL